MYKACVTEAGVPQTLDPHIGSSRIRLDDTPFFESLQQVDVAIATPAVAPLAVGPPPTTSLETRATKRDRSPSATGDPRDPKVTRRTTSASAGAAFDAGKNASEGNFSQSSTPYGARASAADAGLASGLASDADADADADADSDSDSDSDSDTAAAAAVSSGAGADAGATASSTPYGARASAPVPVPAADAGLASDSDTAAAAAATTTAAVSSGAGADAGPGNFSVIEWCPPLSLWGWTQDIIATTAAVFCRVGVMPTRHPTTPGATSKLFDGDVDARRIVARWMAGARNTPAGCLRATLLRLGFSERADPPAEVLDAIQQHARKYVRLRGSALLEEQFDSAFATLRGSLSNKAINRWHAAGGELLVECQMVTPLVREPFEQAFGVLYW